MGIRVTNLRIALKSGSYVYVNTNGGNVLDMLKQGHTHRLALGDFVEIDGNLEGMPFPISVRLRVDDIDTVEVTTVESLKF